MYNKLLKDIIKYQIEISNLEKCPIKMKKERKKESTIIKHSIKDKIVDIVSSSDRHSLLNMAANFQHRLEHSTLTYASFHFKLHLETSLKFNLLCKKKHIKFKQLE